LLSSLLFVLFELSSVGALANKSFIGKHSLPFKLLFESLFFVIFELEELLFLLLDSILLLFSLSGQLKESFLVISISTNSSIPSFSSFLSL
jgi:hypothetical protein